MIKEKSWSYFALICLLVTILLGFILRLGFAGYPVKTLASLDLRQAHSHLGYYGFLFPMIWVWLRGRDLWIPQGKWAGVYIAAVLFSVISFLLSGYSPFSHGFSAVVLGVWLIFAFKNIKRHHPLSRGWLGSVPFSIFVAALTVFSVAVVTIAGFDSLGQTLVRAFLTVLAYGVFLPVVLDRKLSIRFPILLWILGVMGLAGFVTDLVAPVFFLWSPVTLAFLLFYSFVKDSSLPKNFLELRFILYMGALALSLLGFGVGWLPNIHFVAIAGLHFLILGPLLGLFLTFQRPGLYFVYDAFAMTMVLSLLLMHFVPELMATWQMIAALSGGLLIPMVGVNLVRPPP